MRLAMKRALAFVLAMVLVVSMTPVTDTYAASKPKLSKTKATIVVGESTTLSVKNLQKGATVKWSSGNKKIATVTQKGKVTAVKASSKQVKISAKVKTKSKTTTLTCKVTVIGQKTVTTAAQLKAALKNTKLSQITFKTNKAATYKIPKGTYKNVALVIDAPNADIENNGVFKSITIKAIKADTFTEKAKGNKINVTADTARVIVAKTAQLSSMIFSGEGAKVNFVVNGTVNNVAVNAASADVTLTANPSATIKNVAVNAAESNVAIEAKGNVGDVTVQKKAEGAKVTIEATGSVSNVSVNAQSTDVTITANENATVEKVAVNAADANVAIVANGKVNDVTVSAAASVTVGGTAESVPVTVTEDAKGAEISSSVKVEMTIAAEVTVNLDEGAKGSVVDVDESLKDSTAGTSSVVINNDTGEKIVSSDGTELVESGRNDNNTGGSTSVVTVVTVSGLTLQDTMALYVGESDTLTATVNLSNGTTGSNTVTWTSSDPSVATVSENGVITANGAGTATITASVGDVSATCAVTVSTRLVVSGVTLAPATDITLPNGRSQTITADFTYGNGNSETTKIQWSLSEGADAVITSVESGSSITVTANSSTGSATITATAGNVSKSITVNAADPVVEKVELNAESKSLNVYDTATLTATVTRSNAVTNDDKTVTWTSSNPDVVTVSGGAITANRAGTATITASVGDVSAACEVTVSKNLVVSDVTLAPETDITLADGTSQTITAAIIYGEKNSDTTEIKWSFSDNADAVITSSAITSVESGSSITVKANSSTGSAKITATAGGVTKSITVTATDPVVEKVELNAESKSLNVYDTAALTATVTRSNGKTTIGDSAVTWTSSNEGVVTVSENGVITAKGAGDATITASVGKKSATCAVTVSTKLVVTGVTLDPDKDNISLANGTSQTITADIVYGTNSSETTKIQWSLSEGADAVITSVESGSSITVTANSSTGSATITATAGNVSKSITVTATDPVVEKVELNAESKSLNVYDTAALTAMVTLSNGKTTIGDSAVTWTSSNPDVVTVSGGAITANRAGTATITASVGDVSAACEVTVSKNLVVSDVTLAPETDITLANGTSQTITAAIIYGEKNSDTTEIKWSFSDNADAVITSSAIASDASGSSITVKANSSTGSAKITATAGGVTKSITVTATDPVVEKVELNAESKELYVYDTAALTATVTRSNGKTIGDSAVTWTSSDEGVVTVSENGVITAKGAGDATITASVGKKSATCAVTVSTKLVVTGVTLDPDKDNISLANGTSQTITADIVYGTNSSETTTIQWSFSEGADKVITSSAIASDASGSSITVKAISSSGAAVITASAGDVTKSITVTAAEPVVKDVSLSKTSESLNVYDTAVLTATVIRSNGPTQDDKTVTWKSSDTNVATVSGGTITAIGAGKADITASVGGKEATCEVTVSTQLVVDSVNLDQSEVIDLPNGTSQTITADIVYGTNSSETTTIQWSLSEGADKVITSSAIASDASGSSITVKAISSTGSAVITASAGGFTKSITVKAAEPVVKNISLDDNSTSLYVHDTATLKATVILSDDTTTDGKTVTWTSSNTGVATVLGGTITANGAGKTTIKASVGEVSAEYELTVTDEYVANKGDKYYKTLQAAIDAADQGTVTLLKDVTESVNVGKDIKLELNGTVTSVNITTPASVAISGTTTATIPVTISEDAKGASITTSVKVKLTTSVAVTFKVENNAEGSTVIVNENTLGIIGEVTGENLSEGVTVEKAGTITVSDPAVTDIALSKSEITLVAGGETATLTAELTTIGKPSDTVTWSSSNEKVATVSKDGEITPVTAGAVTITATSEDNKDKTATCTVTVVSPKANLTTVEGKTIGYATLQDAVTAAASGASITMLENDEVSDYVHIIYDMTIDLNGKTITGNLGCILAVYNGATLTVTDKSESGDGVIQDTLSTNADMVIQLGVENSKNGTYTSGHLMLEKGKIENVSGYGVCTFFNSSVTVKGGWIRTKNAAIAGNNTLGTMNVYVMGGKLESIREYAIYMPNQTDLQVSDGEVIGGILARMGQIEISGGTITGMASGLELDNIADYIDSTGSIWLGDAIALMAGTYGSDDTDYDNTCNIKITGGTINSPQRAGVGIYKIGNKYDQKVSLTISDDCSITGADGYGAVKIYKGDEIKDGYTPKKTVTIKTDIQGGTFSSNPEQYCDNVIKEADGKYVVSVAAAAKYNGTSYNTLKAAIDAAVAAGGEGTVTLLRDATLSSALALTGSSIALTLDLGGYTLNYTADEASRITDGAKLTVQNGSITADYLSSGTKVFDSDDTSSITIAESAKVTAVASGSKAAIKTGTETIGYATLQDAVTAAASGASITMLDDDEVSAPVAIARDITIDLNGKVINGNVSCVMWVYDTATLTVTDTSTSGSGVIENISGSTSSDYQTITLGDKATKTGGHLVLQKGTIKNTTSYGVYEAFDSSVTIEGGWIYASYAAVAGNNTTGTMNVYVKGGKLQSILGNAIYMPNQTNLQVSGGEVIGGIMVRMGQIIISGGKITGNTSTLDSIEKYYNYSGDAWLGDAIYLMAGTYQSKDTSLSNTCNITITGGTIESSQRAGVGIYRIGNGYDQEVNLTISGGSITGAEDYGAVKIYEGDDIYSGYKPTKTVTITTDIQGGTFSSDPKDYCDNTVVDIKNENGNYVVTKAN